MISSFIYQDTWAFRQTQPPVDCYFHLSFTPSQDYHDLSDSLLTFAIFLTDARVPDMELSHRADHFKGGRQSQVDPSRANDAGWRDHALSDYVFPIHFSQCLGT